MKLDSMRHMGFDQALLPTRMAIVSHSHPSLSKGGAEISAYALYRGLREIGIDAIYIGACAESDRGKLALGSDSEFALFRDAARYDHFYHLAPLGVEDDLLTILQEQRIGLVNFHHFYNIGLNSLRAAQRLPEMLTFLTIHEFLAICHNHGQMVTRPAQILCERARAEDCLSCFPGESRSRFALRKETMLDGFGAFDGFVSPSRFLAERFIEWGLGADRTTVIENGLLSPPEAARGERGEGAWVFGFFGQITPFKGVDVILDAADLIAKDAELARKVRLRIHGNLVGQSQGFTERFEAALKAYPFLTYAGAYNNASVHRLMSDCDYLVIPSKWWENSPVVIQEAYSVGLPVICTGIGGMAEKVPDGVSGLHFRLGDASDLLRAIQLGANRRNHETLRRGIPHVASARDMAERYLAFFATMAATRLVEAR